LNSNINQFSLCNSESWKWKFPFFLMISPRLSFNIYSSWYPHKLLYFVLQYRIVLTGNMRTNKNCSRLHIVQRKKWTKNLVYPQFTCNGPFYYTVWQHTHQATTHELVEPLLKISCLINISRIHFLLSIFLGFSFLFFCFLSLSQLTFYEQ